jgi:hypothetical protein
MSDAAQRDDRDRGGTLLLPADLPEEQFAAAPALTSVGALLINGLSDDEDDAFAAALGV